MKRCDTRTDRRSTIRPLTKVTYRICPDVVWVPPTRWDYSIRDAGTFGCALWLHGQFMGHYPRRRDAKSAIANHIHVRRPADEYWVFDFADGSRQVELNSMDVGVGQTRVFEQVYEGDVLRGIDV